MDIKLDASQLWTLVRHAVNEGRKDDTPETKVVSVNRQHVLTALEAVKTDIHAKHKESIQLWRKSIRLYQNFLKQAPGSQQLRAPSAPPALPTTLEQVKGLIHVFTAVAPASFPMELAVLRDIFKVSAQAQSEARQTRDSLVAYCSGSLFIPTRDVQIIQ